MPNMTATMTMLSVTPSAPPARLSVPCRGEGSGVKKSLSVRKCASRTPKRTNIIVVTDTSARPESAAPAQPTDVIRSERGVAP